MYLTSYFFRSIVATGLLLAPFFAIADGSGLTSLTVARRADYSTTTPSGTILMNCVVDLPSRHAVSSNGERRVYLRRCSSDDGGVNDYYLVVQDQRRVSIKTISTAGAGTRLIEAAISDDGKWVAYVSRVVVTGESHVRLLQLADWSDDDTSSPVVDDVQIDSGLHDGSVVTSRRPFVSADGSYVVFDSSSGADAASQGATRIYLYSAASKSLSPITQNANGASSQASVSTDGTRIAFVSAASNLVDSDTNGWDDIYLWDRRSPRTTPRFLRVSQGSGTPLGGANLSSGEPMLSADGNFVVYSSFATDIASTYSGAFYLKQNVFVYAVATSDSYLVNSPESTTCKDTPARQTSVGTWPVCLVNGGPASSWGPVISGDGRYIAFVTELPDLIPDWDDSYGYFLPSEPRPAGWLPPIQPRILLRDMSEGRFYLQSARALYEDMSSLQVAGWYTTSEGASSCMGMTGQPPLGLSLSADGQATVFEVSDQASHCMLQSSSFKSYGTPDPNTTWSIFLRDGKGPRSHTDPLP